MPRGSPRTLIVAVIANPNPGGNLSASIGLRNLRIIVDLYVVVSIIVSSGMDERLVVPGGIESVPVMLLVFQNVVNCS